MSDRERYNQYLASREWGLLRRAVRERCGGVCERCRFNTMSHVHHLTYIRKYHERPEDLRGLCEGCHAFVHGYSDVDPALGVPITVHDGKVIESVYLAGKIGHGDWRVDMVDDLDGLDWGRGGHASVVLRDGRKLAYAGPHFQDLSGGHGSFYCEGHHGDEATREVCHRCVKSIQEADLFFAWIACDTAYGTLVELGLASAYGKVVYVAGPRDYPALWFSYTSAHRVAFGFSDPMEAFNAMILDGVGQFGYTVPPEPGGHPHDSCEVDDTYDWTASD